MLQGHLLVRVRVMSRSLSQWSWTRVLVHAPQYHWHQEGGVDIDARAAIEKLHKDTHDFAVATVKEVDGLSERIEGVSERIDTTAAAVEQQMDMLLAAGQGA